jgi:hypothetical protein
MGPRTVATGVLRVDASQRVLAERNTGIGTVIESICATDYAPALNTIVDRIAAALRQLCLPRPLDRDSNGFVRCEVREVQPEGQTCAQAESRGREPIPVASEDGREVCRVVQLPGNAGVPAGLGWFYDDFTAETASACAFNDEQQRLSFTDGASPSSGARIRLECLQAEPPASGDIGWPCAVEADCNPEPASCGEGESITDCERRILKERYDRDNLSLTCDSASNTCQLACESALQCPGGFVCVDTSGDDNRYCEHSDCAI